MAYNLLNGQWLGSYDEMGHLVLSKPAGYSLFLAWTNWMPWAPTVTVHAVLLSGFILIWREFRAMQMPREFLIGCHLFVSFAPIWFSETMSRIYRDGLLAALTVLFIGLLLWMRRCLVNVGQYKHLDIKKMKWLLLSASTIGLSAGYFVIIKPSWHFLIVIFLVFLAESYFTNFRKMPKNRIIKIYFSAVIVVTLSYNILPTYIKIQNHNHFGVFAIDSFSKGNYPEAMKAIYGVADKQKRPYIDSTRESRTQIYLVSPTMKRLEAFLELPDDNGWRSQPCHSDLGVCDESGAWFPWEVRDAIEKAGLGDTAIEFEETTGKIATEIRSACQQDEIECEDEGIAPGLDSIDSLSPRVVVDAFAKGFQFILNPMTGSQERGEYKELSDEVKNLWDSTIKGLPPREFATNYESNDLFAGDLRKSLGLFYSAIWIPLFLIAIVGLFLNKRSAPSDLAITLQVLGIGFGLGISILMLQIALLQASSGYYMNSGGDLYLLPLHPLVMLIMVVGVFRLLVVTMGLKPKSEPF
jgi:hypothetical protein